MRESVQRPVYAGAVRRCGSHAIGHGTGDWVWPGESVANGSIHTPAVVVAFDFGTCAGRSAYRKITWYFPSRGESVDAREYQNTEGFTPGLSPPTLFDCARRAVQILYEVSG